MNITNFVTTLGIAIVLVSVGKFVAIVGKITDNDIYYDLYICFVYVLLASLIRIQWLGI